jgi:large conductance mechanosensitive channel
MKKIQKLKGNPEENLRRMNSMLKEFKKFALRGNMIDLAVGIIIGGAFTGIVNSLVNDIVMPLLSILTRNIDFTELFISLDGKHYESLEAAKIAKAATLNYGTFLSGILNFIIMAFVVFLMVRWINKLKKPELEATPTTKKCQYCLSDININATKCPHCTSDVTEK